MKDPMKLTINELAEIVSQCWERGVDFQWFMRPIPKNEPEKEEDGK